MHASPQRPLHIASWGVDLEHRADGAILIEPRLELGPYPPRLTDCLDHWAQRAPDRIFLADRTAAGEWRTITYAEMQHRARAVARWLLNAGLSAERPVAILSGNDLGHAVLALGAMYAGIPYSPISPGYSLLSSDFNRLRRVFELLNPGFVFVNDGAQYARAIAAVVPDGTLLAVRANPPHGRTVLDFSQVTGITSDTAEPLPDIDSQAVAKVLFTSGSTGVPKGVITTHAMLTSNQEMLRTVFPFFAEEPPVICDWLPWNHTFGGSHNFGIALYNGGTMYLDYGRPTESGFETTVANLREIAPTVYFNVPRGFELLAARLRCDDALRERFFSRLRMMFYAAAALTQDVWDELERLSIEATGARIPMLTGLGATETAPFALCARAENRCAGLVGLPVPGVRLKLAPVGEKLEARVKGPNVTPGYWREPHLTQQAFDEDGYYRFGDAVRFANPADPTQGLLFDGRLSEDFKLSTGVWVSVGPLRLDFLLHCAPYVKDVVIAGHGRAEIAALIFPEPEAGQNAHATFEHMLNTFAARNPGYSTRICRAIVLDDPPSLDGGELTDKGTVNQAATLLRRAAAVERLYTEPFAEDVICATV
jgi:feruloyl-CoA synthase